MGRKIAFRRLALDFIIPAYHRGHRRHELHSFRANFPVHRFKIRAAQQRCESFLIPCDMNALSSFQRLNCSSLVIGPMFAQRCRTRKKDDGFPVSLRREDRPDPRMRNKHPRAGHKAVEFGRRNPAMPFHAKGPVKAITCLGHHRLRQVGCKPIHHLYQPIKR